MRRWLRTPSFCEPFNFEEMFTVSYDHCNGVCNVVHQRESNDRRSCKVVKSLLQVVANLDWLLEDTFVWRPYLHVHCEAKKLHHFIFAIVLSNLSLLEQLLVHIYPDKYVTKRRQNHRSPLKGVFTLPCDIQRTFTCYNQRWFCRISLNVVIFVLKI